MAPLPWLRGFTQLKFDGSSDGVTAAGLTDSVAPIQTVADTRRNEVPSLPALVRVLIVLAGAVTNTEISVSVGVTDANGITGWSATQTQEVRSLPDATKVVAMFTFPTLRATSIVAFLESEITGGATAKMYIAFQEN